MPVNVVDIVAVSQMLSIRTTPVEAAEKAAAHDGGALAVALAGGGAGAVVLLVVDVEGLVVVTDDVPEFVVSGVVGVTVCVTVTGGCAPLPRGPQDVQARAEAIATAAPTRLGGMHRTMVTSL